MNHKMLNEVLAILILGAITCHPAAIIAQDDPVNEATAESATPQEALLRWFRVNDDLLANDATSRIVPMWVHGSGNLASHDGEYLAQTKEELQTYYDLGMTWQFISEDWLQRQLQLPDEQGLIVLTANESGAGYKNGFRAGDIILLVDTEPVDTQYDFVIAITEKRGQQCSATIRREGEPMELAILLDEIDESEAPSRYIIGVSVDEISDILKSQLSIENGVAVTSVTEDGPAIKNGVVPNDIITHVDDEPVGSVEQLRDLLHNTAGESIELTLVRSAANLSITLTPQEVPVDPAAAVKAGVEYWRYRTVPRYMQYQPGEYQPVEATVVWDTLQPSNEFVDLADVSAEEGTAAILKKLEAIEEQLAAIRESLEK